MSSYGNIVLIETHLREDVKHLNLYENKDAYSNGISLWSAGDKLKTQYLEEA